MAKHGNYIIEGGLEGKKRLDVLSALLAESTKSFILSAGLQKGSSFLDLGCGGGNVSLMIAPLVGDTGHITAVDFDNEIIALAKADAESKHIHNISWLVKEATGITFENEFDIAYARFLLSHLQDPITVIRKMMQSLKPGGSILVEDIDFSGHFCYPACPAFDRYVSYYTQAAANNKQNADRGQELPGMFHTAGLQDISFDIIQPCYKEGPGKWMAYYTMEKIQDKVIAQGLATKEEITELLQELAMFIHDEHTILSLPRIFRVKGIKK